MSLDIYAANTKDDVLGPVLPFKHMHSTIYDDEGNQMPNPEYIPGVAMSMSSTNFYDMIENVMELKFDQLSAMSLAELRVKVQDVLGNVQLDHYHVMRLIELHNILGLGIARGANKLVWV